jgi:hypothetical protein
MYIYIFKVCESRREVCARSGGAVFALSRDPLIIVDMGRSGFVSRGSEMVFRVGPFRGIFLINAFCLARACPDGVEVETLGLKIKHLRFRRFD